MVAERTGQLREALQQIERGYEDTLQALGAAIDLRDNETAGHSQRVCRYSLEIARAMGWSENNWEVSPGAPTCTISESSESPTAFFSSPDLSPRTNGNSCSATCRSASISSRTSPFLADAAEIVLTHHERYDGSGYPRRTRRRRNSPQRADLRRGGYLRCHHVRPALSSASSFESGREIIRECAGTQFDPQVVSTFLSIPEETWPAIAKDLSRLAPRSSTLSENKAEVRLELESLP